MRLYHSIVIMFIGSFIIQYFFMPPIMVSSRTYITNNIGKAYMAIIMALFMVVLEVMMHDHQYNVFSLYLYGLMVVGIIFFIYLFKNQIGINDKQYLEEMIEHHGMGLLTSEEILKKTDNYHITKLAKNIIQTQEDEIRVMKELLKRR